jgi:hypothetical protein
MSYINDLTQNFVFLVYFFVFSAFFWALFFIVGLMFGEKTSIFEIVYVFGLPIAYIAIVIRIYKRVFSTKKAAQ